MTKVEQNGTTHAYSFDLLGRMTADAVTLASGNPQNVDSSVLRIETSYNTQGMVDTVTSFDATTGGNITNQVQNVYNGLGQLTTQYQEHAGAVNTSTSLHVDYGYSDLAHGSRLASLTYPNGRVLTYNYGTSASLDDTLSRLTSIADGNTTLESYAYLGLGTVVERDHPESGANLTYIKQTGESDGDAGDQYTGLDRFSRVVDQRWVDGSGTALDRYGYSYDRNSNRLTKSNSLNGNLSEAYSYDDLNRLGNVTRGGSAYQSWDLDGLGNMNSVTTGNVTESRTHNAQNQLTSMGNATLAFDNNGNTLTDDQGHTLVYDAWNRLIAVKNGATVLKTFTYDGQGWRISEAPAGGTATDLYYSNQWQVLEERQAGNATAQNVWGITYVDQLVLRDRDADQDTSHTLEERLYALQDANENVTAIITTSGSVAERYVLDAYGAVSVRNVDWSVKGNGIVSASTFGWVYLHQGGKYDVVAGEYIFRHRDYSPTMLRWLQQDRLGYIGVPSFYRYVADAPQNNLDPQGMADKTWTRHKNIVWENFAKRVDDFKTYTMTFKHSLIEAWDLTHELSFKVDANGITGVVSTKNDGNAKMKAQDMSWYEHSLYSGGNPMQGLVTKTYTQDDERWTTLESISTKAVAVSGGVGRPKGIRVQIRGAVISKLDVGASVFAGGTLKIVKAQVGFKGVKVGWEQGKGISIDTPVAGMQFEWTAPKGFSAVKSQRANYLETWELQCNKDATDYIAEQLKLPGLEEERVSGNFVFRDY